MDQVGDDRRPSERQRSQPRPRGLTGGWPAQVQADVAGRKMIREFGVARQVTGDENAMLRRGDGFPRYVEIGRHHTTEDQLLTRAHRAGSRPAHRESASIAFPA